MKTEIFSEAITKRNQIRFLYGLSEILLDPYFITLETGRKVIYGRPNNSSEVRKFRYDRIVNIKVLKEARFSPVIPIIPQVN